MLVDSLLALGPQKLTVRDRMVSTRVVQAEGYRRRAIPVALGAVLLIGGLVALGVSSGTFRSEYTRDEWIADCESENVDVSYCGCVYDELAQRLDREQIDSLEFTREDALDRPIRRALNTAVQNCS